MPDSAKRPAQPARALQRRDFLRLAAASTAAAGLYALGPRRVRADEPSSVKVPLETLLLTTDALANGALDGLRWDAGAGLSLLPGRAAGSYTSPVLAAAAPFTHAGLYWTGVSPDAITFELRWSADGSTWSPWRAASIEAHTPATARQAYSAIVSTGRAAFVQIRAAFDSARGAAVLRSTTVTLLNARDGATAPVTDAPPTPAIGGGAFYTRERWGADDSLRFDKGAEVWSRMYLPVKKLMVHHTDTTNDYSTLEDAQAEVRAIYAYHAVSLGWGDIGYNAIIDKWGNVYEGRRGRGEGSLREVLSPGVVAGHALNHNYGSMGVALLGTFTKPGENDEPGVAPSEAMKASLVDLLAWACARHNLQPDAASDYLLSTDAWNRGLRNLSGHRDCNPTICPGGYVYELLPSLASAVRTRLDQAPAPDLVAYAGEHATPSTLGRVQFDWGAGRAGRYAYLLEGWKKRPADSEDVDYLSGLDAEGKPSWQQTEQRSASFPELLGAFGRDLPGSPSGHYTFHVATLDASGRPGFERQHTLLITAAGDSATNVSIKSPPDGARVPSGLKLRFEASALDPEDGDISYKLSWMSSRDGSLGGAAVFSRALSDGDHTIVASVTDAGGVSRSASVSLRVG